MENENFENRVLKSLNKLYNKYIPKNAEICNKFLIFKMLYENKFIDMCDFNIFLINYYLNELNPNDEIVTYDNFLRLIFFIYEQQLIYIKKKENNKNKKRKKNEPKPDISNISRSSILILLGTELCKEFNIIQFILNGKDIIKREKTAFTYDDKINIQKDKERLLISYCYPNFEKYFQKLEKILNKELLAILSTYETNLYKTFNNYSEYINTKNIHLMNFSKLPDIIWDLNIFNNVKCDITADIIAIFLAPYVVDVEDILLIIDDPIYRSNNFLIKEKLKNYDIDSINIPYSTFVLLLAAIAISIPENINKNHVDAIENFFSNILEFQKNTYFEELARIEEEQANIVIEYVQDNKTLNEAIRMKNNPIPQDDKELFDMLSILDKDLAEISELIVNSCNPKLNHSNKLYYNKYKDPTFKFPIIPLKVENEEKRSRDEILAEEKKIQKAKKGKQNAKDQPKRVIEYEPIPDLVEEKYKLYGHPSIECLKNRLLKNTYNETLWNTNIYPTLIPEIYIIPKKLKSDVAETVLSAIKMRQLGEYEKAIFQFERAQFEYNRYKQSDYQIDLYFNLNFSELYQSLGYNLMSLKYAMTCKYISDKLDAASPDNSLAYSCLGNVMFKIREYEWSYRCYFKAKELREYCIGGDSVDTASIYNNLGVCCYMMQNYYTSIGYFQLAYEIYKSNMGIFHKRTLLIKSNLSKLKQLNFSKEFEYKTIGMHYAFPIEELKKAKKK